jgi:glycosyltransferase involved in cell wall biosynthesis
MTAQALGLSVVLPVYNEETALKPLLDGLFAALKDQAAEIIAVDDGSTDSSAEILSREAEAGKLKFIRHQKNQGYGAALKSGLRAAKAEKVVIIDADGSYDPTDIPLLVAKSGQAEMVVGARKSGFKIEPVLRRVLKFCVLRLLRYLAGFEVPDLNSGLRLFNKNLALKYISLLPPGFSFTSTLTLIFLSEGYGVEFVNINYRPRQGKSKFRINELFSLSLLLLRTIMYFNPLKFFIPLSALLFLLALAVGLVSIFALGKFMDVTTSVLMVSAMQIFVLGLLADLLLRLKK